MHGFKSLGVSLMVLAGLGSASLAARLPVSGVSSSSGGSSWLRTYDDSGMSGDTRTTNDVHDVDPANMGVSNPVAAPHFVRYDLGDSFVLDEMWIWNYNATNAPSDPPAFAKGMKDVVIDYSTNAVDFTTIWTGTIPAASGLGMEPAPADLIVPFNLATARFIRVTTAASPNHNHAVSEIGLALFAEAGLSEVRFFRAEVTVPAVQVDDVPVVSVTVPGDNWLRYNLQEAGSVEPPDWADTGIHVIGSGSPVTLYHAVDTNAMAYYRASAVGLQPILGSPTADNDWSTESVVSTRASTFLNPRVAQNLINGSGIAADGVRHGKNPASMWLANPSGFNSVQRGGTVSGGHWVEFKLNAASMIDAMQIWNYAEDTNNGWQWTALGIEAATIQYTTVGGGGPGGEWGSDNAGDWTTIFTGTLAPYAPPHPGDGFFAASDEIDFGGAEARYVVLTASGDPALVNYIENVPGQSLTLAGLSEVRFTTDVAYSIEDPGYLLTTETGYRFVAAPGITYNLQRAPAGTGTFENTGTFASGTDGEITVFDPAGHSAAHDYRILVE